MNVEIVPITLREARRFVADHHRHNGPPRGWLFGLALESGGLRVGVAIAGRPIARALDDGRTVEITRLALLEGAPHNAASMAYGALCRAAAALGHRRAITYTLQTERGSSVLAAGFMPIEQLDARDEWTPAEGVKRAQRDIFGDERRPAAAKVRWERTL